MLFTERKRLAGSSGMTLTEVLISMAVCAFFVSSVILSFSVMTGISKRTGSLYSATNIAKSRLERARVIMDTNGFSSLSALSETDTIVDGDGISDTDGDYKRTTTVTENHEGSARLTRVDITVLYKYRKLWNTKAPTTLTTVFVNTE